MDRPTAVGHRAVERRSGRIVRRAASFPPSAATLRLADTAQRALQLLQKKNSIQSWQCTTLNPASPRYFKCSQTQVVTNTFISVWTCALCLLYIPVASDFHSKRRLCLDYQDGHVFAFCGVPSVSGAAINSSVFINCYKRVGARTRTLGRANALEHSVLAFACCFLNNTCTSERLFLEYWFG